MGLVSKHYQPTEYISAHLGASLPHSHVQNNKSDTMGDLVHAGTKQGVYLAPLPLSLVESGEVTSANTEGHELPRSSAAEWTQCDVWKQSHEKESMYLGISNADGAFEHGYDEPESSDAIQLTNKVRRLFFFSFSTFLNCVMGEVSDSK